MKKGYFYGLAALVVALLVGIAALLVQNNKQKEDISAMAEMMAFEKEQLEDEYQDLAMQYDGYQMNISNDSLAQELANEKQRVQDLLEELRITKATDGRKIAELKKELSTVRAVMQEYVKQIDHLNRENAALTEENRTVKQQYQAVSTENQTLHEEKTRLTEVVNRASMLEVGNFKCTTLNKRDKETHYFSKIQKLQFDCQVMKNITAQPGEKILYMQIRRPDGELMLKAGNKSFKFEDETLPASLNKAFEYGGEAVSLTLYWPVEEILQKGRYTADFFIDGDMVGEFFFTLD